jgi:hypothetical protein
MEHFPHQTREESTMSGLTRPKLTLFKYSAMLLAAVVVVVAALLAAPTANAKINQNNYRWCTEGIKNTPDLEAWQYWDLVKDCCIKAGGVWDDKQHACNEPTDKTDTRTLPGNIELPPDLVNAPGVTKAPPRPIQVPSDIATVSAESQAPA